MKEQNKNISLSLEEITYLQDYLLDEIQMLASGSFEVGRYTENEALEEIAAAHNVLRKLY